MQVHAGNKAYESCSKKLVQTWLSRIKLSYENTFFLWSIWEQVALHFWLKHAVLIRTAYRQRQVWLSLAPVPFRTCSPWMRSRQCRPFYRNQINIGQTDTLGRTPSLVSRHCNPNGWVPSGLLGPSKWTGRLISFPRWLLRRAKGGGVGGSEGQSH